MKIDCYKKGCTGNAKRFSYRYNHASLKYIKSTRKVIMTGYLFLCDKHIKNIIKNYE